MRTAGGSQTREFRSFKGHVFGEKLEPPEAPTHRSPELLKVVIVLVRNPRIPPPKKKQQESLAKMLALETRLLAGFEICGCLNSK